MKRKTVYGVVQELLNRWDCSWLLHPEPSMRNLDAIRKGEPIPHKPGEIIKKLDNRLVIRTLRGHIRSLHVDKYL